MKKLFISQPMKGKTQEEIQSEREKAIKRAQIVLGEEVEAIDSYFEDYNPENGCVPLKYLAKSLEIMADADVVYFVGEWALYRGCRIEYESACEYGLKVIHE